MIGLKKIWNIFTSLLVIIVVLLAIALVGVRLIGLQPYAVLSGSMEPTYHTGSLIYVKSVDYKELVPGDPITFMMDESTVATHRIVGIVPDEDDPAVLRYRTKGDANAAEDGKLVHYKNIIGTPIFTIPALGYLAGYVQNPPGTYIALCAGAVAILLMFLPELLKALADDDEKEKKPEQPKEAPKTDKPRREPPRPERVRREVPPEKKDSPRPVKKAAPGRKKGRHEL